MRVLAPAKINLHLRVAKRRNDGFHPLHTWMCTVALFDKLIVEPARPNDPRLTCNLPDLPTDHRNLVLKAAAALAATSPHAAQVAVTTPLTIHLEKRIPHGAGLGGGSSDAARTLIAINSLLQLDLGKGQLEAVAATLGSDLSFFFHEPSAFCQGRGELVMPITPPLPKWGVLILPDIVMPTPAVYRRFDDLNLGSELEPWNDNWTQLKSTELLRHLTNDLEPAAFSIDPKLQHLQDALTHLLNRPARMSGSGSTFFTLFDEEPQARTAATTITDLLRTRAIPVELAPQIRDDLHEDPATRY